jgi:hypothetical protein
LKFLDIKLKTTPRSIRGAWKTDYKLSTKTLPGGANTLLSYLNAYEREDYAFNPCMEIEEICELPGKSGLCKYEVCIRTNPLPKSIFVLIQKKEKLDNKEEKDVWRIDDAFPFREKVFEYCLEHCGEELKPEECKKRCCYEKYTPAVLIDYNLSWRKAKIKKKKSDKSILYNFLKERSFIIRTLDPTFEEWNTLRTELNDGHINANCIWVAQVMEMNNGNLWMSCTWEKIRNDVNSYLKKDDTLWSKKDKKWKHHIIILIANEGVLIFGPDTPEKGILLFMQTEQPGAFSMKGYGKVVGETTVFISAIVDCIFKNKAIHLRRDTLYNQGVNQCPVFKGCPGKTTRFLIKLSRLKRVAKNKPPQNIEISLDNIIRASKKGLYLKRRLIELGFIGHDKKDKDKIDIYDKNIIDTYKTNLPFSALQDFAKKLQKAGFIEDCSNTDSKIIPIKIPPDDDKLQGISEILQFAEQTKRDTLDYDYNIISLEEQYYNEMIVLKFEKYITASPQHAQNILRLAGQLEENILHEDSKIYWLSGFSRGNIIYCNDKVYKKTNIYYGR